MSGRKPAGANEHYATATPMQEGAVPRIGLRPTEVAKALGVGATLVRELIARGEIKSAKIGTRVVVPVVEVEAFLARQVAKTKGGA